ncbi:hypothetical protein P9112_011472 [Eukaryota sp. TZLM1-RC]
MDDPDSFFPPSMDFSLPEDFDTTRIPSPPTTQHPPQSEATDNEVIESWTQPPFADTAGHFTRVDLKLSALLADTTFRNAHPHLKERLSLYRDKATTFESIVKWKLRTIFGQARRDVHVCIKAAVKLFVVQLIEEALELQKSSGEPLPLKSSFVATAFSIISARGDGPIPVKKKRYFSR